MGYYDLGGNWIDEESGATGIVPGGGTLGNSPPPTSSASPIVSPINKPAPELSAGGWKPDFRSVESGGPASGDPWDGMPPDYNGIATFTPTPSNPTPPWEGSKGAQNAGVPEYGTPEYRQKAAEIAGKILEPYKSNDNTYDIGKIAEAGKAEYLRSLGVSDEVIKQAQKYTEERGQLTRTEKELERYWTGDGYDIAAAVKDGKTDQLKRLGFTDDDITSVYTYLENIKAYEREKADFEKTHIFIPNDPELANSRGVWITQDSFDKLPKAAQRLILDKGINALDMYKGQTAADAVKLLPADVAAIYKDQSPQDKFAILKAYDVIPAQAEYVKSDAEGNPMYRNGTGATDAIINSKNIPLLMADIFVPGVATVRHWKEMSAGEKAFSIAMDILTVLPMVGAAGKAAKASTSVSRLGRLAAAAEGVGAEALNQLRAPVDVVLHPVQTVKGAASTARDLIENIGNIRKIPEAVITTTEGTVRMPVSTLKTEAEAKTARDTLMRLAAKGEMPVVEVNGQRFTLSRSPLMKEVGGGLAHATPMGESFAEGLKVAAKPGMSLEEQGLFLSHEPLPRFTTSSAFGKAGEKPAIVIVSPETAQDAISTQKIYSSAQGHVAEMEMKFPVDYKLPEPKQRLFTRLGPDKTRVDILLDNPLTPAQRIKLKSLAIFQDLKTSVTPSLLIEGRPPGSTRAIEEGLQSADVERLAREVRVAGNAEVADSLIRANRAVGAANVSRGELIAAGSIRRVTPRGTYQDALTITATGRPIRPVERSASQQPVVFRSAPDRAIAERVEMRPSIARLDNIRTPSQYTREPGTEGRRGTLPRDRADLLRPPRAEPPRPPREEPQRPPRIEPPRPPRTEPPRPPRGEPPRPPREEPPRKPPEKNRPPLPHFGGSDKEWNKQDIASAVAWKQGFGVWAIREPYGKEDWRFFELKNVPEGMHISRDQKTAAATIQLYQGKRAPVNLMRDLGIVNVHISRPTRQAGKSGAIRFTPDRSHPRTGLVSVKRGRVFHTKIGSGKVLSRQPIAGAAVRRR